jgi:uncharacterized integral membrane protein
MRLLFWIVVALAAATLALFAASNRETASFALWPLPFVLELPLYLAVLAASLIGFIAGALAVWAGGRGRRREMRQRGRRIAALKHELAATQTHLPDAPVSAPVRLGARG